MKYIHLMFTSIFCSPFVAFINEHFDKNLHIFFIQHNDDYTCALPEEDNVFYINTYIMQNEVGFKKILQDADKIFLHGMFYSNYIQVLLSSDDIACKTTWLVWGGDLTDIDAVGPRAELAQKLPIIATSKYDYDMAIKKYNVTGERKDFLYPSIYDFSMLETQYTKKNISTKKNIIIGNSASTTFLHKQCYTLIANKFLSEDIHVYSPLSYGEEQYAHTTEDIGRRIFGSAFTALTQFIEPQQYMAFLRRMDIAIFAQTRSQALNTILALAYFGTKIYCKMNTTHYAQLVDMGLIMYDVDAIHNMSFEEFIHNPHAKSNHIVGRAFADNSTPKKIWLDLIFRDCPPSSLTRQRDIL